MLVDFRSNDALLSMANWIRRLVSQSRRRFTEDGFDLDLAYITDRIIAMGFPGEGGKGLIRNPRQEIVRLLQARHMGFYKVYNLCKERSYWYDPKSMGCEVGSFPFEDHQTPPLKLVMDFCEDARDWLQSDPKNVMAVHCKAGKGRTGIMICCLLIYLGICADAEEAMNLFALRRTMNNKGVTIPSQVRYIRYFEQTFKEKEVAHEDMLKLETLRIRGLPKSIQRKLVIGIWIRPPQSDLKPAGLVKVAQSLQKDWDCANPFAFEDEDMYTVEAEEDELCVHFDTNESIDVGAWGLLGDVKVQVFFGHASKRRSMFYVWVNTGFIQQRHTCKFQRNELDKIRKWVPNGVSMEMTFVLPEDGLSESNLKHDESIVGKLATDTANLLAMDEMTLHTTSEDSESVSLLTGRHKSMPFTSRFWNSMGVQRSVSFASDQPCPSWMGLKQKWDEKWYMS